MSKLVIGLIGEKGSGKGTFGEILKKLLPDKKVVRLTFSSVILSPTLEIWNLPPTRKNLQDLVIFMEEGFGEGTLASAMRYQVNSQDADIVLIDGIRWPADVEMLRSFDKNYLIYITASPKTRFERTRNRSEKIGESQTSFEQFLKEEQAKNEIHIKNLASSADFKIVNESSLDEFKEQILTLAQSLFHQFS